NSGGFRKLVSSSCSGKLRDTNKDQSRPSIESSIFGAQKPSSIHIFKSRRILSFCSGESFRSASSALPSTAAVAVWVAGVGKNAALAPSASRSNRELSPPRYNHPPQ